MSSRFCAVIGLGTNVRHITKSRRFKRMNMMEWRRICVHIKPKSEIKVKVLFSIFSTPPKNRVRVVTKHRSDLLLSPNLQVHSNVILSRVGAILLVSLTSQTRALVHTPRRNSAKKVYFGAEVEKNSVYCSIHVWKKSIELTCIHVLHVHVMCTTRVPVQNATKWDVQGRAG